MNNIQVYHYQNEVLDNEELIQEECNNNKIINYDVALKTLLFTIIVYILTNPMMIYYLKHIFGKNMEINIIQTLIFGLLFYTLMVNL